MPIVFELMILLLITYGVGIGIGWGFWGRSMAGDGGYDA